MRGAYDRQLRRVVVAGGGFTGLAAAAALAELGAEVTVLEAHASFDPRFRGELIHPRGVRALDILGFKRALLDAGGVTVDGFAVTPGDGGALMRLPYPTAGGLGLGIEHHAMVGAMRRELSKRPNVTFLCHKRVEEVLFDAGRVRGVRTHDGQSFFAELVVAADGRQSKLRRLMGLEPPVRLLSYTLAVTVEGDVLPAAGHGHVFLGAPGPILAYPFGRRRVRMCIDVPLGEARGKAALRGYVREHYARHVPEPLRAPFLESLEHQPLEGCANHAIATEGCALPGAVLVGEAAGCSHPLTASGMTIGMHDVLVLKRVLERYGTEEAALMAYQHQRYRYVRPREVFTDALYEVFSSDDEGAKALRSGVFRYWASGSRARAKSMAILSGDEASPFAFAAEYARVMGRSTIQVTTDGFTPRAMVNNLKRLKAMFGVSYGRLEDTFNHAVKALVVPRRVERKIERAA
jgi:2-polyprenyl-6-methoxyphenol hydroxylase-like FAD-dependent oxidoreductase